MSVCMCVCVCERERVRVRVRVRVKERGERWGGVGERGLTKLNSTT